MKPTFEQITGSSNASFLWRRFAQARLDAPYHYHPELELTFIIKGRGKRMVGRQVSSFEAGDMVLLGSNLPHTWLSDDSQAPNQLMEQIVIQFRKEFAGETLWEIPEMSKVKAVLEKSKYGIQITGKTRDLLAKKMNQKQELPPAQKLLQLLDILLVIANSKDCELIDFHFMEQAPTPLDTERFRKVYAFMAENYTTEVKLETIAAVANLSPTSFCRFFKKIARQTFVEALTHFRVNHAANLLSSTEKPVSEICFESGFSNISYFNKSFKKALGQNPVAFRKYQS